MGILLRNVMLNRRVFLCGNYLFFGLLIILLWVALHDGGIYVLPVIKLPIWFIVVLAWFVWFRWIPKIWDSITGEPDLTEICECPNCGRIISVHTIVCPRCENKLI